MEKMTVSDETQLFLESIVKLNEFSNCFYDALLLSYGDEQGEHIFNNEFHEVLTKVDKFIEEWTMQSILQQLGETKNNNNNNRVI